MTTPGPLSKRNVDSHVAFSIYPNPCARARDHVGPGDCQRAAERVDFHLRVHNSSVRIGASRSRQSVQPYHPQGNEKLRVAGEHLPAINEQPVPGGHRRAGDRRVGALWRGKSCAGRRRTRCRNRGKYGQFGRLILLRSSRGQRSMRPCGLEGRSGSSWNPCPVCPRPGSFSGGRNWHRERAGGSLVLRGRAELRRTGRGVHREVPPDFPPVGLLWTDRRKGELGWAIDVEFRPDPWQVQGCVGGPPFGAVVIQAKYRQGVRVSTRLQQVILRQENFQRCSPLARFPGHVSCGLPNGNTENSGWTGVAFRQRG